MTGRGNVQKPKKLTLARRAGTIFPVARIKRYLKGCTHQQRIAIGAPIYQAAVMEYLSAEILELAGNAAMDNKKRRITPRHILLAVANDEELNKLLKNVTIPSGGVIPHIAPELLQNKTKGKFTYTAPVAPKPSPVKKTAIVPKKVVPNRTLLKPVKKKTSTLPKAASKVVSSPSKVSVPNKVSSPSTGLPTATLSEKTLFLGQKLTVIQGDISTMVCDAVVHPTNGGFNMTGQVGSALLRVGGDELQKCVAELSQSHGQLAYATALLGEAPGLKAKHLVHVYSPEWGKPTSERDLEAVVKSALTLADEKNVVSIAFPSIGSGTNNFPKQVAAQTILKSISNYFVTVMSSPIKNILFVLYDMESIGVYTTELAKLD